MPGTTSARRAWQFSPSSIAYTSKFAVILVITSVFLLLGISVHAQTLEDKVVYFAEKQGVDPQLALNIALCESGVWDKKLQRKVLDPTAKNPNSSASSVFQILKNTWEDTTKRMGWQEGTDVFDPHLNIIAGIWLLKNAGTEPWRESKSCWGQYLTVAVN